MNIGILCGHQMPDLMKKPEKIKVNTPYGDIVMYASKLGGHDLSWRAVQSAAPPG
jgi:formylmethanofuran dehydrogenase subunit D